MNNVDTYSNSKLRYYLSSILTAGLSLLMWVLTANIVATIFSIAIIAFGSLLLLDRVVYLRGKAVAALVLILLFVLNVSCFRVVKPVEEDTDDKQDVSVVQEDKTNDEDKQEDQNQEDNPIPVVDQKVVSGNYRNYNRNAKVTDPIRNVTFNSNNGGGSTPNQTKPDTKVIGSDITKITSGGVSNIDDLNKEIQNDVDSGKEKKDLADGIVATTDKTTKKDDNKSDDNTKADMDKGNAEEVKPSDEPEKTPDPLPDKTPSASTDEDLDKYAESTKPQEKEDDTKKDDDNKGETTKEDTSKDNVTKDDATKEDTKKEDTSSSNENVKKEDTSTGNTPEKNDSDTEKKDPVSITALDGNKATAGDSVQFKVTGDVAKVEGLDGLKYSFTNGYITVNTEPDVATVLSVTVIGTDGSTATSVVTVNVLNN